MKGSFIYGGGKMFLFESVNINIEKVSFQDLEQLAMINPTVYSCLILYRRGETTIEKFLIGCILALAEHNKVLMDELQDKIARTPPKLYFKLCEEIR